MAKIMPLSLSLSVFCLLSLVNLLSAEDYVSKDVPPDELIIKAIQSAMQKQGAPPKFEKILVKEKAAKIVMHIIIRFLSEKTSW
jgi:hypothetical protein